jgi:hypothetical protein
MGNCYGDKNDNQNHEEFPSLTTVTDSRIKRKYEEIETNRENIKKNDNIFNQDDSLDNMIKGLK